MWKTYLLILAKKSSDYLDFNILLIILFMTICHKLINCLCFYPINIAAFAKLLLAL